jgi:hypothetical protein
MTIWPFVKQKSVAALLKSGIHRNFAGAAMLSNLYLDAMTAFFNTAY